MCICKFVFYLSIYFYQGQLDKNKQTNKQKNGVTSYNNKYPVETSVICSL